MPSAKTVQQRAGGAFCVIVEGFVGRWFYRRGLAGIFFEGSRYTKENSCDIQKSDLLGGIPFMTKDNEMAHETILIVDDDDIVTRFIYEVLAPSYTIVAAYSAPEALALIAQGLKPDLILSDLIMPGMSGYEFCARLKSNEQTKDIPIIILTALSQPKQEEEGLSLGAADYIGKPVRPELLKARVKTHLQLKAYREHLQELVESKTHQLIDSQKELRVKAIEVRHLFETMGELLASRDHYTSEHALRVAAISIRMGREVGLGSKDLEILELGCLVHDIGKVAIPDDVLLKPGRFDKEDRQIMECHPLIGDQLFAERFADERLALIIRQHHERLDGSGYPDGLKGDEIDDLVKIVMVADVYEALIARRPYKQPMNREKAMAILYDEAIRGKMVESLVRVLEKVTLTWDPLQIHLDLAFDYMSSLELFRRKTYFREPLSDFYNYRYLSSLEHAGKLCRNSGSYHIIKTDFNELKELNYRIGYAKADTILDQIGHSFHKLVEDALLEYAIPINALMLLRRGSDYLIYSEIDPLVVEKIASGCKDVLDEASRQWGIKATVSIASFAKKKRVDDALEEIYGYHKEPTTGDH